MPFLSPHAAAADSLERKRKKGREIRRESRKKVSRTNAPPPPCIAWLQAFLRACYVRGEMWSPNRRKKKEEGLPVCRESLFSPSLPLYRPSVVRAPLFSSYSGGGRQWNFFPTQMGDFVGGRKGGKHSHRMTKGGGPAEAL